MAETPQANPPPQVPPTPSALELERSARFGTALVYGGILAAVAVSSAFLVSPGLYSQSIPTLSQDELGKPFRLMRLQCSSIQAFQRRNDHALFHEFCPPSGAIWSREAISEGMGIDFMG